MLNKLYRPALVLTVLLAAACGTVATPEWSEQAQETRIALAATADQLTAAAPSATPTSTATLLPTPTDPPTPTPTDTPTVAPPTDPPIPPTDAPAAAAAVSGDPANGQVLFSQFMPEAGFACSTCHYVDQEAQLIGPGLLNIGNRAETRVPGQSAYEYIYNAIVHPNEYVVEGYPAGLMPQTYGELFTDEQIEDIIAYLFALE